MQCKHKTVVVPVDFSDDTEASIRAGLERVEDPSGLHLLHVVFPLDVRTHGLLPAEVSDRSREETAETHLRELTTLLGAETAHITVLAGDAGLQTADYAKKVDADLIIVPSHGYHGVKRFLLGSTAERIIRHAHCSVLGARAAAEGCRLNEITPAA
ncbi:MAG: universal stress protein [Planctomycetota bacterium]|nr:universal stress protein [Planctomycetaceae bacterium]MDQ3330210.1 universal stress protein [Planctomycetota bacterium]